MRLFSRQQSNSVLYLIPVKLDDEQLPRNKIRMLSCNADGEVSALLIEKSEYQVARRNVRKIEQTNQGYATLGLEINPGRFVPVAIEISEEELWALEHILEHALNKGVIPDVLKKYPKQIIKLGETKRAEIAARHEKRESRIETTPGVLHRLPYYLEEDIEMSIPIYKAERRYPLVALKRISPNDQTPPHMQRLLVLDSDGDLAIIRVPLGPYNKAENDLEKWKKKSGEDGCIIYSRHNDEFETGHLAVSVLQRKALDVITEYFQETGYRAEPVPADVRAILSEAKRIVSPGTVSSKN